MNLQTDWKQLILCQTFVVKIVKYYCLQIFKIYILLNIFRLTIKTSDFFFLNIKIHLFWYTLIKASSNSLCGNIPKVLQHSFRLSYWIFSGTLNDPNYHKFQLQITYKSVQIVLAHVQACGERQVSDPHAKHSVSEHSCPCLHSNQILQTTATINSSWYTLACSFHNYNFTCNCTTLSFPLSWTVTQ